MSISSRSRFPAAMAASAAVLCTCSRAEEPGDPLRPGFELNVPAHATIYGRLAMGYLKGPDEPGPPKQCGDLNKPNRGSRTRSFLGFRATETLSGGLYAHFQLESSLLPGYGTSSGDPETCSAVPLGPRFAGGSSVGLSDRYWGVSVLRESVRESVVGFAFDAAAAFALPSWAIFQCGMPKRTHTRWSGESKAGSPRLHMRRSGQ